MNKLEMGKALSNLPHMYTASVEVATDGDKKKLDKKIILTHGTLR